MFKKLTIFTTFFAFVVIVLGAFVRLSDAGLGCPDWPGCYGKMIVPTSAEQVAEANLHFPERALEQDKAWKEMAHRYFAGALGLLILAMAIIAWRNRKNPDQQLFLPLLLLGLVIFQSALGMWTVTLLLKPAVVTLHLLAGLATLSLLLLTALRESRRQQLFAGRTPLGLKPWAAIALLVLIGQIALGGWTSTNYVAMHCPDFPTCQGKWLPELDFKEAFTLWRGTGVDYEGGVLSLKAGVTVHYSHRLGAVLTLLVVGLLALRCILAESSPLKKIGWLVLSLLLLQVSLGIANVMLRLPIPIAVAHNGVAALLLLSMIAMNVKLSRSN